MSKKKHDFIKTCTTCNSELSWSGYSEDTYPPRKVCNSCDTWEYVCDCGVVLDKNPKGDMYCPKCKKRM